jgi:hypothetical protein
MVGAHLGRSVDRFQVDVGRVLWRFVLVLDSDLVGISCFSSPANMVR